MNRQEDEAAWLTTIETQQKSAQFATLKQKGSEGRKSVENAASPTPAAPAASSAPKNEVPAAQTVNLLDKIIFILGGPGSGKGTACEKLAVTYNLLHLSVGDLLRDEAKSGSEQGEQIQALMNEGKIVPLVRQRRL